MAACLCQYYRQLPPQTILKERANSPHTRLDYWDKGFQPQCFNCCYLISTLSGKSSVPTSCKEMVSRTFSPCSHGGVDECASPPNLVTGPLLQSPADVLKTQQSVLTVFPRVRPHPFSSLSNIVSMGIRKSRASLSEFHLTLVASSTHWKIRWENFREQIWILLPEAGSAIKGSLVSLFIWLFPLSDIASDADTEVKSQSTPAQTNGFSPVH